MTSERPIGYWLKLVDGLIDEEFRDTLEEHGVTRRQWQLLNLLSDGAAHLEQLDAELAPFFNIEESSAEHLEELVDSEWVALADGQYSLTERGTTTLKRLSEVVARNREKANDGISEQQYSDTLQVLERMARNLGWSGEPA